MSSNCSRPFAYCSTVVRGEVHAERGGPVAHTEYGELGFTYAADAGARGMAATKSIRMVSGAILFTMRGARR